MGRVKSAKQGSVKGPDEQDLTPFTGGSPFASRSSVLGLSRQFSEQCRIAHPGSSQPSRPCAPGSSPVD